MSWQHILVPIFENIDIPQPPPVANMSSIATGWDHACNVNSHCKALLHTQKLVTKQEVTGSDEHFGAKVPMNR